MSNQKEAVLFALLNEMRNAVQASTGDNDPPDHLDGITVLIDAAEKVLAGIPVD